MNVGKVLYHWAIFKRGFSEGSYAANVIQFVMLLTTLLIVINVDRIVAIASFLLIFLLVFVSMYLLGKYNMRAQNAKSILRADVLADPNVQNYYGLWRDQLIYLQHVLPSESASLEKTIEQTSFWILEPVEEARKRVLKGAKQI